jgi:hypothetical protein
MKLRLLVYASLFSSVSLFAAEESWTGQISDSVCGQFHPSQKGPTGPANDPTVKGRKQCALICNKNGSPFVFVVGDKVFDIANQNEPNLMKYAGEGVKITGTLAGKTITATKVEPWSDR